MSIFSIINHPCSSWFIIISWVFSYFSKLPSSGFNLKGVLDVAKKTENVPRMVHQYTCFSERITAIFISFLPLDTNNDKTRQSTQKQMEVVRKLNTPDTVFFLLTRSALSGCLVWQLYMWIKKKNTDVSLHYFAKEMPNEIQRISFCILRQLWQNSEIPRQSINLILNAKANAGRSWYILPSLAINKFG